MFACCITANFRASLIIESRTLIEGISAAQPLGKSSVEDCGSPTAPTKERVRLLKGVPMGELDGTSIGTRYLRKKAIPVACAAAYTGTDHNVVWLDIRVQQCLLASIYTSHDNL